jgi:flavin reductase (DIM6/NTAB) family NADH-FMN oxidoreductase RutF
VKAVWMVQEPCQLLWCVWPDHKSVNIVESTPWFMICLF